MKLKGIAERIDAHLKRFETDPSVNIERAKGLKRFYMAGAEVRGTRIFVVYTSYQGAGRGLTKQEATEYLEWLDAGNTGRHYEFFGRKKKARLE